MKEGESKLSAEEYFAAEGISNSMLGHLARSPAHFKYYLDNRATLEAEEKPYRTFGRVVHQMIFEPMATAFFTVRPEGMDGRTKEGKQWAADFKDFVQISAPDYRLMMGVADSILNHPLAQDILRFGAAEIADFKESIDGRGILRKGRLDFVTEGNAIADIKTCLDARPREFAKSIYSFAYHRQAAYYLDLWNDTHPDDQKTNFVLIAVEKTPPHNLSVMTLAKAAIEKGRTEYRNLLAIYTQCKKLDSWPGYEDTVTEIDLPTWAYKI